MLTAKQRALLTFIDSTIKERGVAPSYREMATAANMNTHSSMAKMIDRLVERGFLLRRPARARALEVIRLPGDVGADAPNERAYLRLVLVMASSFQGGHSGTGRMVADALKIAFPLNMDNLERAARERGFNPDELWPWLSKMRQERADAAQAEKVA